MNKQEQIEKLASLMADCNTTCDKCFEKLESVMTLPIQKRENYCQVYAYAQRAVEQGYRKIPEGNELVKVRKETEKEILDDIFAPYYEIGGGLYELTPQDKKMLYKKYGLEIEE